jgi:amidase
MLDRPALELAAMLRRREVSSVELTRACLDTIAARDRDIAAFVDVSPRRALAAARRADHLLARGGELPPFLGVPTGIKDHEPVRFHFTRLGSAAFRWLVAPYDGHVARACKRAGFVIVGKTSCSELTLLPIVDVAIHAPTRNPHDLSRYSGGSSGGAAAAVAAGMLPIAPGADGGGSIRIPAAFCGLVGFKVTRGALPNPYGLIDASQLCTIGPVARTVRDAAALLDALAAQPDGSFARALGAAIPRLRVRVLVTPPIATAVDAEIEAATRALAERLAALGHDVSDAPPMRVGDLDDFIPIMAQMAALVPVLPGMERRLQPATRWMRERGRGVSRARARALAEQLAARVLAWFGDADVVVSPTVGDLAPEVGSFRALDGEGTFRAIAPIGAFTAPFNLSGQPAVSLPVATTRSGLPIGVQLVGRLGADRLLLSLADRILATM